MPVNGDSNIIKWDGQRKHRQDHLITDAGEGLIFKRSRVGKPFIFYGSFSNAEIYENNSDTENTPTIFQLTVNNVSSYNNVKPGTLLTVDDGQYKLGVYAKMGLKSDVKLSGIVKAKKI
jgi:hypothetical protein